MTLDEIKKSLRTAISELDSRTGALQEEQNQSETEHDNWNDSDEGEGIPEPLIIDNQHAIDAYSRCASLIENALDELGDL